MPDAVAIFPRRAGLDFLRNRGNGRRHAALETDINALIRLYAFGNLESLFRLADIDAHRLLAIHVLAPIHHGFEMLHVEERRRGDLHQIHILAFGQLLEGVRTAEHQLLIDGRAAQLRVHFVEAILARGKLIGEDVGQRDHLRGGVLRKRSRHGSAAIPAPQQARAARRNWPDSRTRSAT